LTLVNFISQQYFGGEQFVDYVSLTAFGTIEL
jgi:hypothetical protein